MNMGHAAAPSKNCNQGTMMLCGAEAGSFSSQQTRQPGKLPERRARRRGRSEETCGAAS